ncbi:hypothetical protein [Okeania sp. SIO2B3]|nr:hypothetical protein [Okeania sp. SIO2B3]
MKIMMRQLYYLFAPIMCFPVLLSLMTGSLFQISVIIGTAENFIWLLE